MKQDITFEDVVGRVVGTADYFAPDGRQNTVGDVLFGPKGAFELMIGCVPKEGVLELNFNEDLGEGHRELSLLVEAGPADVRFVIGDVNWDGLSGRAVFYGTPVTEGRLVF